MIVVGLTGGIASGKSTIIKLIRKKNIPVHDSDLCVKRIYQKPSDSLLFFLKKIGLKRAIKRRKIDRKKISNIVFKNKTILYKLEQHMHMKIEVSRNRFLKKQRKQRKKMVFLDIPLLFEKKLDYLCDYTFLLFCPIKIRKKRALSRRGMNIKNFERITKIQLPDKTKIKKANYVFNTSKSITRTKIDIFEAIKKINKKRLHERNNIRH